MSRRVYIWDDEIKQLVEVGRDWTSTPRRAQTGTEELTYGGLRATDGTDISSRKKHREYMHRNNLTIADDYKETWKKSSEERQKVYSPDYDRRARREAVERAIYTKYKP